MNTSTTTFRLAPVYLLACAAPVSLSVASMASGLCLLAALVVVVVERERAPRPPRIVLAGLIALFTAYLLATVLAGPFPSHWHKLVEEFWLKPLLVAVPVLLARRPGHAPRVLGLLLLATSVAAAYAVWQHFTGWDPIRERSLVTEFRHVAVTGFVNHHLSFGGQLLVAVLVAAAWLAGARPGRGAWLLGGSLALLGLALLWSYARGPLLGAVCGLGALALLLPGWRRWLGLGLVSLPVVAGLLMADQRAHLLRVLEGDLNVTRLNLWRSSLAGLAERPLLGYGPGNFKAMLAVHEVEGFYNSRSHAHNDLIMHGVNAGVVGMVAALLLGGGLAFVLWRARRCNWIVLAGLAVLVGLAVAGQFQVYQTDDEVEMVLYLVVGCGLALVGNGGGEDCQPGDDVRH